MSLTINIKNWSMKYISVLLTLNMGKALIQVAQDNDSSRQIQYSLFGLNLTIIYGKIIVSTYYLQR